jgi:hypothetical protein
LLFEGREEADAGLSQATSAHWQFIDLVSLDRCIGHNAFGVSTATLVAEAGQRRINDYATALGLPVEDRTFLMNREDLCIIRYDAATSRWYNDGMRLAPGTSSATNDQFGEMTTDALLAETGQARLNQVARARGVSMFPSWTTIPDKAAIVNQRDARRMMYDSGTETWSEVPNNDAIYHVHDRTHYADLKDAAGDPLLLAQIRCVVQSIMNTEKPPVAGSPVAMPEMQLFGLPADRINTGEVATVSYLKAEDAAENLHDVLGRYQTLPHRRIDTGGWGAQWTVFRFYIGAVQNIATTGTHARRLYLSVQNMSGTMVTASTTINAASTAHRDISVSGNFSTSPTYFELFIHSASGERIILSSGLTGGVRR